MTEQQQHPLTPPPELVQQWRNAAPPLGLNREKWIATQAARWGADQELEACMEWMWSQFHDMTQWADELRAARRPKPPSLVEQALAELDQIPTHDNEGRTVGGDVSIIRAALDRLKELESND